jgi:hydroxyacylglutathione hydrolase
VLVDARPLLAYGAEHIAGSLSNTLRPVFGSWLGWLVLAGTPLVFVLDSGKDRDELVRQCLDVGHEHLVGDALDADGRVIDVRQAVEYRTGHVPGAVNVELGALETASPPVEGSATVMCGHGERAMAAASLLAARGIAVRVFDGGPDTWAHATGRSLEVGDWTPPPPTPRHRSGSDFARTTRSLPCWSA